MRLIAQREHTINNFLVNLNWTFNFSIFQFFNFSIFALGAFGGTGEFQGLFSISDFHGRLSNLGTRRGLKFKVNSAFRSCASLSSLWRSLFWSSRQSSDALVETLNQMLVLIISTILDDLRWSSTILQIQKSIAASRKHNYDNSQEKRGRRSKMPNGNWMEHPILEPRECINKQICMNNYSHFNAEIERE